MERILMGIGFNKMFYKPVLKGHIITFMLVIKLDGYIQTNEFSSVEKAFEMKNILKIYLVLQTTKKTCVDFMSSN
jgi:hypothetical protein